MRKSFNFPLWFPFTSVIIKFHPFHKLNISAYSSSYYLLPKANLFIFSFLNKGDPSYIKQELLYILRPYHSPPSMAPPVLMPGSTPAYLASHACEAFRYYSVKML